MAAVAVLCLVTAACSGGSGEDDGGSITWFEGSPESGEVIKGSLDGRKVVFAGNGGIMEEAQRKHIAEPFTEQSGAEVVFDLGDENKLRSMVQAGDPQWDVVNASWTTALKGCGEFTEKLDLDRIDTSKLPDIDGITGECYVPAVMYANVLVYDTEKYKDNPPTSWADFFDTKKFPGKRAVNTPVVASADFLNAGAVAAGKTAEEIRNDPMDLDAIFAQFDKIKDDAVPWETGAQLQELLESGEVDMAWAWSGRAYGAQKAGAKIAPVWNGANITYDPLVIPKGVKNIDRAYAFINYYLGAQQQAGIFEETSYTPLNTDAEPNSDELLDLYKITPERQAEGVVTNFEWYADHLDEVNERWAEYVSGL